MTPRYTRTLSPEVERELMPGGRFRFLLETAHASLNDPDALDIQIRDKNELMYYHGTTRLLKIHFSFKRGSISAKATANLAYGKYPECRNEYAALKRTWKPEESEAFHSAFRVYLPKAISAAQKRYYKNRKEGYWQNKLCARFGEHWKPGDEWLIIDRECVLGFANKAEKRAFYQTAASSFQGIRDRLQQNDPVKWGMPKSKKFGDELDLLALNTRGNLVVIELKYGTSGSGVYWGPLQVGFYHRAFSTALNDVVTGIKELALQKVRLKLLPPEVKDFLESSKLTQIDAVLAVADPKERSTCWQNMNLVIEEMGRGGIPASTLPIKIARVNQGPNEIHVKIGDA